MKISRLASSIAISVALLTAVTGCGSRNTVTVDGEKISNSEMKESMREVSLMVKNVKPGDPSGMDLSFEPKTVVGKKMKALLIEAKDIHLESEKAIAGVNADEILSAKRLSNAAGRAQSRTDVATLQAADEQTMTRMASYFEKAGALVTQLGVKKASVEDNKSDNDAIMKLAREMYGAFNAILDFADREKPTYDASLNQLTFSKDSQIDGYNKLLDDLQAKAAVFEKEQARVLAKRAASFNESMRVLESESN